MEEIEVVIGQRVTNRFLRGLLYHQQHMNVHSKQKKNLLNILNRVLKNAELCRNKYMLPFIMRLGKKLLTNKKIKSQNVLFHSNAPFV